MKLKIQSLNDIYCYTEDRISSGTLTCRVMPGHQVRFDSFVQPIRHRIFWIKKNSPLVYLAVWELHSKLGSCLGVQAYINGCQLIGISAPAKRETISQFHDLCQGCLQVTTFFKGKSPVSKALLRKARGPDNFVATSLQQDPLMTLFIDQTGLVFYNNPNPNDGEKYLCAYILLQSNW